MDKGLKEIPTTELRAFYNVLRMLSTSTRRGISDDFTRSENAKNIANLYIKSRDHFEKYENTEEKFINTSTRKPLGNSASIISSTNDVTSDFLNSGNRILVHGNSEYDFKYVEREVSPIRTTKAQFDTGKSGSSSGSGGLDFIGWNIQANAPILGEIKVNDDEDPFFALIQLLTYCSELCTKNQLERIKKTKLFGAGKAAASPFYLYVLLVNYNSSKNEDRKILLKNALEIGRKIQNHLNEDIEDIVFMNMDKKTKRLNIIR